MKEHLELVPRASSQWTPTEAITRQFYQWEARGRGWQIWPCPVEVEPEFVPFIGHYLPPSPVFDDARKPTLLRTLAGKLTAALTGKAGQEQPAAVLLAPEDLPEEPAPFCPPAGLVELQVSLLPEFRPARATAEQFLLNLTYCESPVAFELLGFPDSITLGIACGEPDSARVSQQLAVFFPEAKIGKKQGLLESLWNTPGRKESVVVDFGLSHEFMRPLRVFDRLDRDPLVPFVGALANLAEGELALLQVLFQRARYPWVESILRAVTDWEGGSFFVDSPEMATLAKQKVSSPLFACVIRVAAASKSYGRAWERVRLLGGGLAQFTDPLGNELIPLDNDGYADAAHAEDLVLRQTRRSGMLLNSQELVALVHLSAAPLRIAKSPREEKKTKAAPRIALGHRLVIGENLHQGQKTAVSLGPEHRIRHTYVIGASGTGKSTLLLNMIIQDIQNGEGVGVLDPHGDLIDQILGHVPEGRSDDIVLLDPSDEAYPVGFNILSAHSELEKNLLGSDLVDVFRRLSTSWGDQMGSVLSNTILAVLESTRGGTLLDLRRFLVEPEFRTAFLETVRDSEVVYYWEKEFPLLKGKPQAPILTRLDTFLRPKLIRYMVSQTENRLDFRRIMDERRIFLAKLAQGAIGEVNAYLLGALLVSKFHQVAMGRQELPSSQRANFYLYIDEFQNFVTPSMASILSGARKYHLGLVLAHQELRQLWNRDTEVASAVISNPSIRICFRLGDFDAKKLAQGFSAFDASDLQNLGIGEAICRIERAEYDFNLKTLPLPKLDLETAGKRREQLIALSRQRYGRRRDEVAQELASQRPRTSPHSAEERPRQGPAMTPAPVPSPAVAPVQPRAEETSGIVPRDAPLAGRGGQRHKYLQQLVKRLAEARGWRATIEQPVLGGAGLVDVALERAEARIACEISVTSTGEHEIDNARKCLAAGFAPVILIAADRRGLHRLKEALAQGLQSDEQDKVLALLPDEFVTFLEEQVQPEAREDVVKGYKVKVKYRAGPHEEKNARKQAISQVILGALHRLKGGKNQ